MAEFDKPIGLECLYTTVPHKSQEVNVPPIHSDTARWDIFLLLFSVVVPLSC